MIYKNKKVRAVPKGTNAFPSKTVLDSTKFSYEYCHGPTPDRHPQKDFFILDISDVVPKDDMASMEHPLLSLATQLDMRHLVYRSGENSLEIIPSGLDLPTIKDKDIQIFFISQLMDRKNRGEPIGNPPQNAEAAFLAYCKKQGSLRRW